jgi:hypothetical protein
MEEASMKCDDCDETFTSARGLAAHKRIHQRGEKCDICGREVKYLASHRERAHGLRGTHTDPISAVVQLVTEVESLRLENARYRQRYGSLD